MIIQKMHAGLANQLYEYAAARRLAYKNKTILKLDLSKTQEYDPSFPASYRLGAFNIRAEIATPEEIDKIKKDKIIKQNYFAEFVPEVMDAPKNVYLDGWWGNENYFKDIRNILLKEITLKNPLSEKAAEWKKKILDADYPVSLHMRYWDYTSALWRNFEGHLLTPKYYSTCIDEAKKMFPNLKIFVFSNDLELARYKLKTDVPVEFVEGCETDAEDFWLMSLCKSNIISNSTFSWWAAWINQNPEKKVWAPPYFASYQDGWINMPGDYAANLDFEFPPFVSLIVRIENDENYLKDSLVTYFKQKFRDFELIIINSGLDGSKKICRSIAQQENVFLLQAERGIDKFSAWNLGLNVARGHYVVFLTAKDFLIPDTAGSIPQYLYREFGEKAKNVKGAGLHNWENFTSDIFCATKFLEESDEGTVEVGEKKFVVKVDEQFKDLQTYVDLNVDDNQKLIILGSGILNTHMNTKCFKRTFLNEKNLRFRSSSEAKNPELIFLSEAMLATERIVLVPQILTGKLK